MPAPFYYLTVAEKQEYGRLWRAVRHRKRQCYTIGCNEQTRNTHVLGQSSILKYLANKSNHFIQMYWPSDFSDIKFQEKGIVGSDVMSFQGFCQKCDKQIFSEIEDYPIIFSNYRHQMLLLYRGAVLELHKVEVILELLSICLVSRKFSEKAKIEFTSKKIQYELRRKVFLAQKKIFDEFIRKQCSYQPFVFIHRSLPKIEIAISALIFASAKTTKNEIDTSINHINYPSSYMALIPQADSLECLIAYTPIIENILGISVNGLRSTKDIFFAKFISDILLKYCESWVISHDFTSD